MPANKNSYSLYGGEVEIDFYPDSHRYKMVGERSYLISVTSATGIIDKSRFLIPWAVNLAGTHLRQYLESIGDQKITAEELYPIIDEALLRHEKVKEEAAGFGTRVHDFCENFAKFKIGKLPECPEIEDDLPEEAVNGINAFIDWFSGNDVQFIDAERLIYSKKYEFTGLCDAIATVNGKLVVIDYKTGKGIYNEAYYQVAGYALAYEEETNKKLDGSVILNFGKDTGELNAKIEMPREELDINKDIFLACLTIKKREKELSKLFYQK